MPSAAPPPATEPRHPIRVVAQRTGLTPATLRAWERRYGVVEPWRSEGGQRLYSDLDVERLARLRLLAEAGRPISLVASLDDAEAERLLREDRAQRLPTPDALPAGPEDGSPAPRRAGPRLVDAALRRVLAMDGEGLETALRRAAVTLGAHPFLEEVVAPLLHRVGVAWTRDELGPAEEHLCSAVTERVLSWLAEPTAASDGPRLVVATLPGERHGLGARLVAAAAGLEGWRVTHLGVDLPPASIARAARTLEATAVALSLVNSEAASAGAAGALAELRAELGPETAILLGGAMAARLDAAALPANTEVVEGLSGLGAALGRLA